MATLDTTLTITHLSIPKSSPSREVQIEVRVRRYEQNIKPNFSSVSVYGRMDPIFTYQNTVRTFRMDCHTIPEETDDTTSRQQISKLFKFMYPIYESEITGTGLSAVTTNTLKGPPILQMKAPKILTGDGAGNDDSFEVIFIPEVFDLTSGLANEGAVQYVTGPDDLRFLAPANGYGFTIGGTILHKTNAPGWINENGTISFTKKNFPLGVE